MQPTIDEKMQRQKAAWERKPSLRSIYRRYSEEILRAVPKGKILEVGSGSGSLENFADDVVTIDIQTAPWIDAVADAQALPFRNGAFSAIAMIDVLHHLERPRQFFEEARRVLREGGRLVMIEPAITPVSRILYDRFHEEPVDLSFDPFSMAPRTGKWGPWDANIATPSQIFDWGHDEFCASFPDLSIVVVRKFDLFTYPLTGGFQAWSLMPERLVRPALALENLLEPLLGPLMALRLMVVVERVDRATAQL